MKKLSSRLEKEKKENKAERLPQEEKKGRLGFKLGKAHNTFRNNNLRTGLTNWLIIIKIITTVINKIESEFGSHGNASSNSLICSKSLFTLALLRF